MCYYLNMKHSLRKIFAPVLVAGVIFAAFLGALSVLPHAHGDDLDHSSHKSCPVYQKGSQSSDAVLTVFQLFLAAAASAFILFHASDPVFFRTHDYAYLRAPPAASV